jgi:hypothetical protein
MSGALDVLLGSGRSYVSLSTTVTAGDNLSGGNGSIGFINGTIGSLSTSAAGAGTIVNISDLYTSSVNDGAKIFISGFSSDPGQAFLGQATFHSVTLQGSAAFYSYSSGTAAWEWATPWNFANAGVYPGTVQHQ